MELQERPEETGSYLSWRLSHPFQSSFAECNSLVLWATRVSPEQILTGICEACQKLQARVPGGWDDAELLLIGTGPCNNGSRMGSNSLKCRNISVPSRGAWKHTQLSTWGTPHFKGQVEGSAWRKTSRINSEKEKLPWNPRERSSHEEELEKWCQIKVDSTDKYGK